MARPDKQKSWGNKGKSNQKGYFLKFDRGGSSAGEDESENRRTRPKQLYLLVGLLVVLLAFVAITFYLITRDSRNQQAWIGHSTQVQVLSQQMAKSATEAGEGRTIAFYELGDARTEVTHAMMSLREGDAATSLPKLPGAVSGPLNELNDTWQKMDRNAQTIIEREALIMDLSKASSSFIEVLPRIQQLTDEAVRSLTQSDAPSDQIFAASRQLVLADRMLRHLREMLRGGSGIAESADSFEQEVEYFGQLLTALLKGSRSLGVSAVRNTQVLRSLGEVRDLFNEAQPQIEFILASSADLLEVRSAADGIILDSKDMFDQARNVSEAIQQRTVSRIWPSLWSGSVALIVMLLIVAWLMRSFLRAERERALEAGRQNQRNQQAIMRLLDEMESLADGDLTVHATVTEDMTGAIADSVNFAVEQLRELVNGINITAQTVAESAQETMSTTSKLAEASGRQAEHVRAVTDTINEMAGKLDVMAERSSESSEVAERSVDIANNGAQMVQQTITGMDTIRDQIQKTSKRIKRLGESSQEIGDIVELINGIAEQTNILALNAAIQSASAGGAGRGFAVVADEVQRLAERASNATRRIEMLVKNIQTDTAEAVVSMESTTSEVVRGAKKAEDAGEALERIESVSNDLSRLITENSQEAQEQSRIATQVAEEMQEIRDISIQTSEGTNQTARSMGTLANLVRQLRESVADFKLPAANKEEA
ncbi:methyl-accepting chemotaxis protein [Elongatibacter sediminis]|uniref:Methyl-accepting chemotaxis protein n=1 Tax=Elongatibacter sediminis TaxID=3119006 RepID=A0AAW9RBT6_9GAMM